MHVCNLDCSGEDLMLLFLFSYLMLVGKRKMLFVISQSAKKRCSPQPLYPETHVGTSGGVGKEHKQRSEELPYYLN